jgi:hypothetical protein
VDRLRTGFYYIAKKAGVPIVMAGLDFEKKEASFQNPFLQRMMKLPIFNISIILCPHQRKKTGTGHGTSSKPILPKFLI